MALRFIVRICTNMKYISLFAGIGGFDLALNRCGHECVFANEWDKYAATIYRRNIGELNTSDIRLVRAYDIPNHELLVGGFPCQAFSVAGKRAGFSDTRGTLFFEIARILENKRPRYFLLENVRGLLSHDGGKTFQTIIRVLSELGYDLQWQILNSKYFGVPQNRERIFIIGSIRGSTRPQVFPILRSDSDVDQGNKEGANRVADTITTRYAGRNGRGTHIAIQDVRGIKKNQNGKGYKEAEETYTIDTLSTQGILADQMIRRLTPLECERLQGFPDGWTEGVSDSQRYKCLGNAVTVNVVEYLIKQIDKSVNNH